MRNASINVNVIVVIQEGNFAKQQLHIWRMWTVPFMEIESGQNCRALWLPIFRVEFIQKKKLAVMRAQRDPIEIAPELGSIKCVHAFSGHQQCTAKNMEAIKLKCVPFASPNAIFQLFWRVGNLCEHNKLLSLKAVPNRSKLNLYVSIYKFFETAVFYQPQQKLIFRLVIDCISRWKTNLQPTAQCSDSINKLYCFQLDIT